MTPAALISELATRGVEFQANGEKLRIRPVERLTPDELEAIGRHKAVILNLLRAECPIANHPAADPRPLCRCDRCSSTEYTDVLIHHGRSLRRDCTNCHRFLGWPRWYGRMIDSANDGNGT